MVVNLKLGADAVESSPPRELFSLPGVDFDISPDGQRFLSTTAAEQSAPSLTVSVNWPVLVKQTENR